MKVLITGSNGQLGKSLIQTAPKWASIFPYPRSSLDITSDVQVRSAIETVNADVIINTAAYTKVDLAERNPSEATAVNSESLGVLSSISKERDIFLLHISTDYVFSGTHSKPYTPSDTPLPINIYGKSKWAGEQQIIKSGMEKFAIVRTSWLYSHYIGNFASTILKLLQERDSLTVINDQISTPTHTQSLSFVCWTIILNEIVGTYHWADAGIASWYDFAVAIQNTALRLGILKSKKPIKPISSEDYPSDAARPSYSVLDSRRLLELLTSKCQGEEFTQRHWQEELEAMLHNLVASQASILVTK